MWSRLGAAVAALVAVAVLAVPLPREESPLPVSRAVGQNPVTDPQHNQFVVPPATSVLASATTPKETSADFPAFVAVVKAAKASVHSRPANNSEVLLRLGRKTEHGAPQTLLVLKEVEVRGHSWLKVLLPVRPNGTSGWVQAKDVDVQGNPYTIEVHLGAFRLDLLERGQVVRSVPIGVGTEDTPTPGGTFYVMELMKPPKPNGPYGTFTYVLNGYSNVIQDFNGGKGLIGIHGTNQPELVGQRVSHGCIRMSNSDIEALAAVVPLGTEVHVFAA